MKWLILPVLFISFSVSAQWKSYRLSANKDTINRIDQNDLKQGRWVVRVESLRGEPGYDSEGIYVNGKKEGVWRSYTLMGDLFAVERFKWGYKDGKNQYYTISGLEREESWRAINPANPFDTVEVFDPIDPYKVKLQVVKVEGNSVKHGAWRYFDLNSGQLIKTENWFLDKLDQPKPVAGNESGLDSAGAKTAKVPVKTKPKEVEAFEKKIGKKKIKVIDGRTY